jgi:hypothetical protein
MGEILRESFYGVGAGVRRAIGFAESPQIDGDRAVVAGECIPLMNPEVGAHAEAVGQQQRGVSLPETRPPRSR